MLCGGCGSAARTWSPSSYVLAPHGMALPAEHQWPRGHATLPITTSTAALDTSDAASDTTVAPPSAALRSASPTAA